MFNSEFLILYINLKISFLFLASSFRKIIFDSNASRVFTQLNQPISVLSKISTNWACVGSKVITFDKYWLIQPLSELADVRLRGLYGNFFIIYFALFSKISHSMTIPWKLYKSFTSDSFLDSKYSKAFSLFRSLRPRSFHILASYKSLS